MDLFSTFSVILYSVILGASKTPRGFGRDKRYTFFEFYFGCWQKKISSCFLCEKTSKTVPKIFVNLESSSLKCWSSGYLNSVNFQSKTPISESVGFFFRFQCFAIVFSAKELFKIELFQFIFVNWKSLILKVIPKKKIFCINTHNKTRKF